MPAVILPSTKAKDAYALLFDPVFIESAFGKAAFLNANPQSKYQLGGLSGLALHFVPNELAVLSAKVAKGPDAVVAFTFSAAASGCRVEAAAINLPDGEAGEKQRAAMAALLEAWAARFGGKTESGKKKAAK